MQNRMLLDPQRAPSFSAYDAIDVQVMKPLSMAYRALGFRSERSVHLDPKRETIPKFSLARSVLNSCPRLAFYSCPRCDRCSPPVAKSDPGTQHLLPDLHSPSGFLNPFGS
jgi:hypothetical protein